MALQHATYMDDEALALFLLWGQTDEDRAALAEHFAEERAVAEHRAIAQRISATGTVSARPSAMDVEITEDLPTVRVLLPTWGYVEASIQDAFAQMEAA